MFSPRVDRLRRTVLAVRTTVCTHYVSKNHGPYHLTQLPLCAHKTQLLYTNVCLVLAAKLQAIGTSWWSSGWDCDLSAGVVGSIPDRELDPHPTTKDPARHSEDWRSECSTKTWHSQVNIKKRVPAG